MNSNDHETKNRNLRVEMNRISPLKSSSSIYFSLSRTQVLQVFFLFCLLFFIVFYCSICIYGRFFFVLTHYVSQICLKT